jgi:hypothetical protein
MVTSIFFNPEVTEKHVRGVGPLLNHRNAMIYKKTAMNALFAWVHWSDTDHTHEIPLSLASCYKLRFSVASEIRQGSADSLFHPQGHIPSEQPLLCQNKQLARALTLECTWRVFLDLGHSGKYHGEDWRFVFGSHPKTHVSSPVKMPSNKLRTVSAPWRGLMVAHMQCFFRSIVMTRGTNFAEMRRVFKTVKMVCHVPYDMPAFTEILCAAYRLFARINSSTRVTESSSLLVKS